MKLDLSSALSSPHLMAIVESWKMMFEAHPTEAVRSPLGWGPGVYLVTTAPSAGSGPGGPENARVTHLYVGTAESISNRLKRFAGSLTRTSTGRDHGMGEVKHQVGNADRPTFAISAENTAMIASVMIHERSSPSAGSLKGLPPLHVEGPTTDGARSSSPRARTLRG